MPETAGPEASRQDPSSEANPPAETPPSVRRSLLLSFSERYVAFLLQIATTAVLARLLSPADYGAFTVAAVIVSITQSLRDFGAMGFIIQERELTEARVQTVYGISLLIGCVAAAIVALAAQPIARFYQDAAIRDVLLVLSINFLLVPYGSLVLVLLRREMQFDAILRVNLVSVAINSALGIVLAVLDFRAMSLAWGSLAGAAATCAMGMMLRRRRAHRLLPAFKEWRRIVSFGTIATTAVVVSSIGQEAPDLLIGRFLGVDALGIYGRASGLVAAFNRLVSSGIAPVAVSALALRHRSGQDIREEFIAGTVLITGVAWPFFVFLALMAFPVTRILFGEGWDAAVPITRILSLSGAVSALANLNQLTLQAKGAVKNNLGVHIVVQPLVIAAVALAAQFNLFAVATAFILGSLLFVIVSYHHLDRLIGVSVWAALAATRKSAAVTATSALGPAAVLFTMPGEAQPVLTSFVIAGVTAGLGWLIGLALCRHPLFAEIKGLAGGLRRFRATRPGSAGMR